jgi:dolichol-phosphate mannosyltransferase
MLSIVVPTYKEAENLPLLAEQIDARLRQGGAEKSIEYELLIVDDMSPDDTVQICENLAQRFPLKLLRPEGRPRDLSLSVIDGISAAAHSIVLVMDADLSHPPEKILEMLGVIDGKSEAFAIGSRYIGGGSFDRDWSLWRFLNSHVATLMARPLVKCSDPMSGFFMFNKEQLGDLTRLKPIGYKIGLEIMVRGNFTVITEIPIGFKDRELGASKMNFDQQWKYLRHLRRLYLHRYKGWAEFVHFGIVGTSGLVVDLAFYYLFQFFGASHTTARGFSFWPAVSWNWALNRKTTFGDRERRPKAKQWFEFVASSLVGFTFNWGIYVTLTNSFAFFDRYRLLALIVGVASASIFNFAASTLFVYNDKRK